MSAGRRNWRGGGLIACACLVAAVGCAEELDTERVIPARGTLGEEIYKVFCQRVASEENPRDVSGRESRALCEGRAGFDAASTPRLRALAQNRDRLVRALDRVMPEELHDDLQGFAVQMLPLYDAPDERMPRQTRAAADLLQRLVEDEDALAALERMGTRKGYRPMRLALGLARPILAYPGFDDLARQALDTIDEGGPAGEQWDQLLRVLALEMASAEPEPRAGEETTLDLTRQLLFTTDPAFASGPARWVTRRDDRGIALIAGSGASVPGPFVDRDGDGLADVDTLGRFVDTGGLLLDVAPPFQVPRETGVARDASGRTLRPDGTYYFDYMDANPTFLAGLSREGVSLFQADAAVALDMAYGLPPLLGPETIRAETYGAETFNYVGYETADGALFDVLHAVGVLLHRPETEDLLEVSEILLRDHESEVAALIEMGLFADRRSDERDAALVNRSNLWDDLIQIAVWIAQEPGLLEGLLRSFTDPRSARLGAIYAEFMRYRDEVSYDPSDPNRLRTDVRLTDPVDRARADVLGNQSLYQRSISLIHDLSGVRMCNKEGAQLVIGPISWPIGGSYRECELIEIDNVAELFSKSVVGTGEVVLKDTTLNELLALVSGIVSQDELLEDMSGITGFTTHPTPQALARLVFAPRNDFLQNIVDPPQTRDGVDVESRHQGVIFSWEKEFIFDDGRAASRLNFYDSMTPMLTAFDEHDGRTSGPGITPGWTGDRFLFGEFVSSLHLHWPSPASDTTQAGDPGRRFFSHQSDGVSYEENVADTFDEGEFTVRLHDLSVALDNIEIRPGVDGITVMARATEVMVDPRLNSGLRYRDGRTTTPVNDGSRTVDTTPLYQMLDGLRRMDEAFTAAPPERHARWLDARGALVDQFLTTRPAGAGYEMENQRAFAALRVLLPFLRNRIRAHREAGDLGTWAGDFATRAEDTIGGAMGSSTIRFLDAVQANDPDARAQLSALVAYLVDESSGNDAFDNTLVATADLLQVLEDDDNMVPLIRALSNGIAPNATEVVDWGGDLQMDGSAMDATMQLMREINLVDDRRTLKAVLGNLVALDPGEEETPLEVILDVIAEVNRADPGAGTRMDVSDFREMMERTRDFMRSESRGMERLYDVMQQRQL